MKIAGFGVEEWLNVHEREAKYDLAQSTITSFSMDEIKKLTQADIYNQLNEQK
ncbi:aminotransferase [Companilactobacillus farciminis]|nr:aminotransferase [Companilactobacillus farciminis]